MSIQPDIRGILHRKVLCHSLWKQRLAKISRDPFREITTLKQWWRKILIWHSLAFGDSYTYVQGTVGLQNYSFIGDLQNYTYTPEQLLADEIVQNQVFISKPPRLLKACLMTLK